VSNTQCNLCHNPSPYMCPQCEEALNDEKAIHVDEMEFLSQQGLIQKAPKIFIGSGEDVMLETWE
jgi:hypothetical protein